MTVSSEALIEEAKALVKVKMSSYDPSHDYLHIERVFKQAVKLAQCDDENGEGYKIDHLVVQLGALFHDLQDYKYQSTETTSEQELRQLMIKHGLESDRIDTVIKIMGNTSYSHEAKLKKAGQWTEWHLKCKELHCVQDADRLDATGAFGIMRVAAYSGAKNRPLFDPESNYTSYFHFEEKLLLLKDSMKTKTGSKVGLKRHAILQKLHHEMLVEYNMEDF
ncbi:hypothetical protein NADFUDRAFT_44570 [Nadsonia fulvescens var. elongata DSM 6958]|uniref:HD/PDEase domain-containing protein n=1 Tax=Nadsonia fulvescens var. elongata DSM 6958 TaxID=857566 RepID=A0A1E3PSP1_9ASCO|nr:hypothetical protein NADFUDRAFT_44570 [Nadsonia fulvescens var. elongata DSM 6958]